MLESISSLEIFFKAIFEQFLMQKTKVANFHDFPGCFEILIRSVGQIRPWVVGHSGMQPLLEASEGGSLVIL